MRRIKGLGSAGLAAVAALAIGMGAPVGAFAQEAQAPGGYVQVNAGLGVAGQADLRAAISGVGSASADVDLNAGGFASLAAGRSFEGGFALEVEGLFVRNNLDTVAADEFLGFDINGRTETFGLMGNAMYALGRAGPMVPYVGAGVGFGKSKYTALGTSTSDSGVMWQARAGLSFPMSPTTSWDFGYRYLQGPDAEKSFTFVDEGTTYTATLKGQTSVHVLTIGGRFRY